MKYTYLGFSQHRLIELGLNDRDALILRYFIDYKDSGKMTRKIINGEPYYWFVYDGFLEEFPIVRQKTGKKAGILNKDAIYRRLKTMVAKKILKHTTIRKRGTFSYYALGKEYFSLISDTAKAHRTGQAGVYSVVEPKGAVSEPERPVLQPKGTVSEPERPASESKGPAVKSEQRSFNYIHHHDPSVRSSPSDPSTTSSNSDPIAETDLSSDADVVINRLLSEAGRPERITAGALQQICVLHHTNTDEVQKAVRALIVRARENARSGGEPLRNIIGILKGRKNGNGRYHSGCFYAGECILPVPEAPQSPQSDPPLSVTINWQAQFDALPDGEQALYLRQAETQLLPYKSQMTQKAYQETVRYSAVRAFITTLEEKRDGDRRLCICD